ncbi:MAG: hypothetical protein ACLP9C_08000 [Acidimicrobiales bacterium]
MLAPIVVVLALLGSHRGYRSRQRRKARSFDGDDTVAGEALLAPSRRDLGLPPDGPELGGPPTSNGVGGMAAGAAAPSLGLGARPGASPPAPPGWYPDPEHPGSRRSWYGNAWAPAGPSGGGAGEVPPPDAPGWGAAGR